MKNKKIKFILLEVLIILLFVAAYFLINNFLDNNKNNSNNQIRENANSIPISRYSKTKIDEIFLEDFTISNITEENISINYRISNETYNKVENKNMAINFYDSFNKIIYTYEYDILFIDDHCSITVNDELKLNFKDVKRYEVIYESFTTPFKPIINK